MKRTGIMRAALLALGLSALHPVHAREVCPTPTGREATAQPELRRGHDLRFQPRLDAIAQALASGRQDVLMLGDSLIQQWPQGLAEQAFPGMRVLNAGMPGYSAANLLARLRGQASEVLVEGERRRIAVTGWERQRPAFVLVLVGNAELTRGQDSCAIGAGVAAVLRQITALYPGATILLSSLLPRGAELERQRDEIAAANAQLRAVAAAHPRARFLDLHSALRCAPAEPCGLTRPPNHGHLTEEGYRRVTEALARDVRSATRESGGR